MLTILSISEFAAQLVSKEQGPGGGSAAALMGLTGASLAEMVVNLAEENSEEKYIKILDQKKSKLKHLHIELQLLIDRDAEAFRKLVEANALPAQSREEQIVRQKAIQLAAKEAAEVPLWTARICLETLELISDFVMQGIVPAYAMSDLLVGAFASHAGAMGALMNTAANLTLLNDSQAVSALKGQIVLVRAAADTMIETIRGTGFSHPELSVMRE